MLIIAIAIAIPPLAAQSVSAPTAPVTDPLAPHLLANPVDGYPVVLDGQELFRVKQGIPGLVTAAERARLINERLIVVADDAAIAPDGIRVEEQGSESVIKAGETVLLTVRDNDRQGARSRQQTAEQAVQIIRATVAQYRQERSIQQLTIGTALAVFSTVVLVIFLLFLQRLGSRLLIAIRAARQADALDLRVQNVQILGSDATSYLLTSGVKLARVVLILGSLYLYIPFVLSQFPATRYLGQSILTDIGSQVSQTTTAIAQYLPNLVILTIIVVLAYYAIEFSKLVIAELGREEIYSWFYPEWVQPTSRLVMFLIVAIACVVASPYLPGFGSPSFQGISLFLGALLTLGSSSAVANAISGIILIYTRAFRPGDMIRIADVTGEVIEKTLFVTRMKTFKQEIITIPNSSVLSSHVVNFNAILREPGGYLVLYTTITLGYDVPWRKVHAALIQAAIATDGIVSEPSPFVLQTNLNDYHVSYELNAYSDHPEVMPVIYSALHQNIQDHCNQAGIEILSPAYSSLRDGNHSTIPANYLPDDYTAPGFRVNEHKG